MHSITKIESLTRAFRIGIDGRELLPQGFTGSGRYLSNFLQSKVAETSGHHFVIYGQPNTQFPPQAECFTFKILKAKSTMWWDQVTLVHHLKRDNIDLFFTPYDKMPWRTPCPVVLTIHDILYQHISDHSGLKRKLYNTLYRIQRGAMARKAACILTVSEYSRNDILNFYHISPNRITITYNAVSESFHPNISTADQEQIQKKYGLTSPYILNLSNFKPHKNPGMLIEAFAQMPPSLRHHTHLVLAGMHNTFTEPLRRRVKILNLEKNILFPGIIDEEDLPGLYAGACIFAFPSTYEGFGLPPLEAMSCGIPVISSNATSLPEVIGQAGLLIDPHDAYAWSKAFVQLLQDTSLQKAYSEQGRERAKKFSLEIISQNILNALVMTVQNCLN